MNDEHASRLCIENVDLTKIVDDDGYQTYTLPNTLPSGNIFIKFIYTTGTNSDGAVNIDHLYIAVTQSIPNYRHTPVYTIDGVPAGNSYELQLNYRVLGENFEVYVYDNAVGDYVSHTPTGGALVQPALTVWTDSLSPNEYLNGLILVKIVDTTLTGDLTMNVLELDYLRVLTTVNPGLTNLIDYVYEITNNQAGAYQSLQIEAYTSDEPFTVSYSDNAAGPWTVAGTVTADTDPQTYTINPMIVPLVVGSVYIRFEDLDRTAGDPVSTLYVDHARVQTVTSSGVV